METPCLISLCMHKFMSQENKTKQNNHKRKNSTSNQMLTKLRKRFWYMSYPAYWFPKFTICSQLIEKCLKSQYSSFFSYRITSHETNRNARKRSSTILSFQEKEKDTCPKKSFWETKTICPINSLRHKLWSNYCLVSQINNNNNYKNVVTLLPH